MGVGPPVLSVSASIWEIPPLRPVCRRPSGRDDEAIGGLAETPRSRATALLGAPFAEGLQLSKAGTSGRKFPTTLNPRFSLSPISTPLTHCPSLGTGPVTPIPPGYET